MGRAPPASLKSSWAARGGRRPVATAEDPFNNL
eukprot:CAMPEP_0179153036 /NCGR_PEP_ID=MMETSP0796-20121207/74397_1 /TAXON_ID=73915 /ORGANISM="Pyrodinium bahamense, Strain pbaha01" /LENGTH=32 /DNA_ID= /DNA_START= /DNA_END= /DNA_ORIENTATION=